MFRIDVWLESTNRFSCCCQPRENEINGSFLMSLCDISNCAKLNIFFLQGDHHATFHFVVILSSIFSLLFFFANCTETKSVLFIVIIIIIIIVYTAYDCLIATITSGETFFSRAKLMEHSPSVEVMARLVCRAGEHMIQFVERWNVVLHNIFPTTVLQGTECVFPLFFSILLPLMWRHLHVPSSGVLMTLQMKLLNHHVLSHSYLPLITGSN